MCPAILFLGAWPELVACRAGAGVSARTRRLPSIVNGCLLSNGSCCKKQTNSPGFSHLVCDAALAERNEESVCIRPAYSFDLCPVDSQERAQLWSQISAAVTTCTASSFS